MKTHSLHALIAAASLLAAGPASAVTIFQHNFGGSNADLDGTAVDVGTGNWIAAPVFNQDGSVNPAAGSATLAFSPSDGNVYNLDVSLSGVSGNTNQWFALGFADGQSNVNSNNNRFIQNLHIGKAWMLFRANTDGHQAFRGNATSGTANGAAWTSLGSVTGAIDMRIELDTTGGAGSWEATWLAKLPADSSYTVIRASETLLDETINSVGIALAGSAISGNVDSFTLTLIPEPSSFALLGLGGVALLRRRRKF